MNRLAPLASPLVLVLCAVALQLASAWILGRGAHAEHANALLASTVVIAAIGLNMLRFLVWRHAHQHYPLSHTYPLTALFFPCILVMAYFEGEAISLHQAIGTVLITSGALTLASSKGSRTGGGSSPPHNDSGQAEGTSGDRSTGKSATERSGGLLE